MMRERAWRATGRRTVAGTRVPENVVHATVCAAFWHKLALKKEKRFWHKRAPAKMLRCSFHSEWVIAALHLDRNVFAYRLSIL